MLGFVQVRNERFWAFKLHAAVCVLESKEWDVFMYIISAHMAFCFCFVLLVSAGILYLLWGKGWWGVCIIFEVFWTAYLLFSSCLLCTDKYDYDIYDFVILPGFESHALESGTALLTSICVSTGGSGRGTQSAAVCAAGQSGHQQLTRCGGRGQEGSRNLTNLCRFISQTQGIRVDHAGMGSSAHPGRFLFSAWQADAGGGGGGVLTCCGSFVRWCVSVETRYLMVFGIYCMCICMFVCTYLCHCHEMTVSLT